MTDNDPATSDVSPRKGGAATPTRAEPVSANAAAGAPAALVPDAAQPDFVETLSAVALLDEPVRRDLYEWVIRQPDAVGRDDAAEAVGISRALAAFHLDRLAAAGLLETEFRRRSGRTGPGAGRPAKLYRRSLVEVEVSLPQRQYGLAAELFARALEGAPTGEADPSGEMHAAYDAALGTAVSHGQSSAAGPRRLAEVARDAGLEIGRRQAAHAGSAPVGSGPRASGSDTTTPAQTAPGAKPDATALHALEAAGYEPVVDDEGSIRLRNCPFHALVAEHRDLTCGMNLALLEGVVEGLGEVPLRAEADPRPGWCCVVLRATR